MISINLSSIQSAALPQYAQNHAYVSNFNEKSGGGAPCAHKAAVVPNREAWRRDLAAEYFIGASSNFCRIATFMRIFHWRPAKPPALTLNVSV
jgi:hypothetical protein